MCMYLTGNGVNKKHNKPNADGYLVGYKVLVQKNLGKIVIFPLLVILMSGKLG